MAGKIIADQLQSTSVGTVDTKYVVTNSIKVRANTNNTGTTINESFNVSSLTDAATGQQDLFFTNNMSTTTWSGSIDLRSVSADNPFLDPVSTSKADGYSFNGSSYSDNYMLWMIVGDLA